MSSHAEHFERFLNELAEVADRLFTGDHTPETVDEVVEVLDEAEDVLQYVDVEDLAAAIDLSKLPDVVDLSALPDAFSSGKARKAIHLRALLDAVDLTDLATSADLRAAWRESRELDDAIDDVVGDDGVFADSGGEDDEDGELFDSDMDFTALSDGDDEETSGEAEADDGLLDSVTGSDEHDEDADAPSDHDGAFDGVAGDDLEALRMGVQQGVLDAVDEFREGLLAAHEELAELRAANLEANERRKENQSHSRNPTAVSTVTGGDGPLGGQTIRGSTVPTETKYSKTPNRKRIYGERFEDEEVTDE